MKKELRVKTCDIVHNSDSGSYSVTWDSGDEIKEPEPVSLRGIFLGEDEKGLPTYESSLTYNQLRAKWEGEYDAAIAAGIYISRIQKAYDDFNKRITATVTKEMLGRIITVTVITRGTDLFAGYSVCSPMDKFDSDKARVISTGRAMKKTTNLLQGETIGSMRGKHLNRAIAFDILNKIEKGKLVIKGIRDANNTKEGTTTETCKTTKRK